tara:strand:+ start:318 stop:1049 length:732 start_codon:yes stop_codon:yes gene_type:complete
MDLREHVGYDSVSNVSNVTEHDSECMCGECGMNDIDNYAGADDAGSGYVIAPNQQIHQNQLDDSDFIASIVTQVIQQLKGNEELVEWKELESDTQQYAQSSQNWASNNNVNQLWPDDGHTHVFQPAWVDPCGENIPPHLYPDKIKRNDDKFDYNNHYVNDKFETDSVGFNAGISGNGQYTQDQIKKLKQGITTEIAKLVKEQELEEGSCGYSIEGEGGDEPAGPHLIKKPNLQERFKKLANIK